MKMTKICEHCRFHRPDLVHRKHTSTMVDPVDLEETVAPWEGCSCPDLLEKARLAKMPINRRKTVCFHNPYQPCIYKRPVPAHILAWHGQE